MKTYNVQFRKSFEVTFHGEIEAKSEKDADKKLRQFAKKAFPESDPDTGYVNCDYMPLDDGDDFNIWER